MMAKKKEYKSPARDADGPTEDYDKDREFVRKAMEKYERAFDKERTNITSALEDLEFRAGEQWPTDIKRQREADYRPVLTINRIPQFVRQITGDIRNAKPAIKVVPIDNRGDPKTAEILGGLVRYIENRSDARHAYHSGADSQVTCGIGHWRVITEYAGDTTFDQEIRITAVDDGVGIVWDADSNLPNKEDARCCFVPVDLSHEQFKERYPDAPIEDFALTLEGRATLVDEWFGDDFVRVAEYWERRNEKRMLALLPDGTVDDVTDEPDRLKAHKAAGYRIEEREGTSIYRSVISSCHLLEEPTRWPGRFIPIVPVFGEEVVIGRRTVRHGVVRYLKDPQRAYNYFRSAETEAVALQPKSPWLVTEKQVENYEDQWLSANSRNYPYLLYNVDPKAPNAPQRIPAGMDTSGMVEGLNLAASEMQSVVGIYDAGLGARSNETSGKAIQARKVESDIGSNVYAENFSRAIKHTGRIILDLIPTIYDAARTIRIVGEDGRLDVIDINKRDALDTVLHDVTVAAYDVTLDVGPSYESKREQAREGMLTFMQQAPDASQLVLDLVASAMDWPNADKFAKRMRTLLPPAIQAEEAQEAGEQPPPPPPPNPELVAKDAEMKVETMKAQAELQKAEMSLKEKQIELEEKQIELRIKQMELAASRAEASAKFDQLQTQINQIVAALQGQPTG